MGRLFSALDHIAVALWTGGLWTVGYLVAPLLFLKAPDRQVAGHLAGQMFAAMAFVGLGCAAYLLVFRLARHGFAAMKQAVFWVVVLMAVLAVAGHFGVQPILASLKAQALPREVMESVFRDRFATWHGVASILYLIESALAVALVLLAARRT
jgi:Domain of unknown function (DUF4149)